MPTQIVTPKAFTAGMPHAIYSESTLDDFIESVRQQPEGSGLIATAQEVGLNLQALARTVRVSAEEYRDLVSDLQAATGWKLIFGKNQQRDKAYGQIVQLMHQLDEHSERYVSARRLMQVLLLRQSGIGQLSGYLAEPPKFNPDNGRLKHFGMEMDLSDYKVRYRPTKRGKWGPMPLTADDFSAMINGASGRLRDLLHIIESATDKESINSVAQRRDFLEERMNASFWAFVAAEWQANKIINLYENFLYRKAREDLRAGMNVDTVFGFLMLPKEEKTLLKTMREARIQVPTRLVQAYRDVQLHHSTGLYVTSMVALTTSTVGSAAGLLPPIGDMVPPLANVEPFKFLGGYVWSLVTGIAMYALTQAGPWTVAKLRSRGSYVQV